VDPVCPRYGLVSSNGCNNGKDEMVTEVPEGDLFSDSVVDVSDGTYGVKVGTNEEVWIVGSLRTAERVVTRNHRSDVTIVVKENGEWVKAK
jgi:hypothetical protein